MTRTPRRLQLPRSVWPALARPEGADIPLGSFLLLARPAYGGRSWENAIAKLLADPDDAEIVGDIAADLLEGRPLVEPVRFHRRDRRIGDGMHRVAAHVLTAAATIRATTRQTEAPFEIVELEMTMSTPGEAAPQEVDPFDGWGRLLSFRLGPVWVSSDFMSSSRGVVTVDWYCPHEFADALVTAVQHRARESGRQVCVLNRRLTRSDALD